MVYSIGNRYRSCIDETAYDGHFIRSFAHNFVPENAIIEGIAYGTIGILRFGHPDAQRARKDQQREERCAEKQAAPA